MVSPVWEFFRNDSAKSANCNICKKDVLRGGSTSALEKHLRNNHSKAFGKVEEKKKAVAAERESKVVQDRQEGQVVSSSAPLLRQASLHSCMEKVRKWEGNDERAKAVDRHVIEMIALDDQPFSVVDDTGFSRLINKLEPRYSLKSRKFYSDTLLPQVYGVLRKKVQEALVQGEHMSFTCDAWSSQNSGVELLSLTVHFVTADFKRVHLLLNTLTLEERHTGDYLRTVLRELLDGWGVDLYSSRMHLLLRDGAANMVSACAPFPSLHCFAHNLQLVLKDALFSQAKVKQIVSKARDLASHVNHSNRAKKRLLEIQKTINADEWELMERIVNLLQPFEQVTKEIQHEDACISVIIPMVKFLSKVVSVENEAGFSGIKTMVKEIRSSLANRFQNIELEEKLAVATFLDPHYKSSAFTSGMAGAVRAMVEAAQTHVESESDASEESSQPPAKRSRVGEESSSLWGAMNDFLNENSSPARPDSDALAKELDHYREEPRVVDMQMDPITWWAANRAKYPKLAILARKFLSPPPTTVPSERVFSGAGNIYSDHRSRLGGEKCEQLLFVKYALRKFGFNYDQ